MDVLSTDLRHTLGGLRRDVWFTAITVLTLGLGIGANTAVFSVVRSTILKPLPYQDPGRLAMLWTDMPSQGVHDATSAYANIEDWRTENTVFEDLATFDPTSLTLMDAEWPLQISAARVSANLFAVLGIAPEAGRTFSAEEERQQAPVVVLSQGLSERRFGTPAAAIGRTVEVEGAPLEVIGVMPEGFGFAASDAWLPETLSADWNLIAARRGRDAWRVVGRLAPGVSLESARGEMRGIAARLERDFPDANAGLGINVVSLADQVTGASFRLGLWTLFGAVGLVLLIACANAAHLILARGNRRAGEFSLRVALGATTPRLIRQTLTEGLVVSLAGGLAGLLLAVGAVRLLVALAPENMPRLGEVAMDPSVLVYAAVVSGLTGVVFGVIPVLGYARGAIYEVLREGRVSAPRHRRRLRNALVPLQLAMAVVLLFGASLLIRSLLAARSVDLGFDPDNVVLANLSVASESERVDFYDQVVRNVRAIPGVQAAGIIEDIFISGAPNRPVTVEEDASQPSIQELRIDAIAGDFFRAVGAPLLQGRDFSSSDGGDAPPVAIVNETMARRLWPGTTAVGKRFRTGDSASGSPWIEVVGVVGDMRRQGPERAPIAQAFRPYVQAPSRNMNVLIRTDAPLPGLVDTVRARLAAIDATVPLYRVTTLQEASGRYLLQRRFQTFLLGLFSSLALVLAAAGVYGLLQYSVSQRTRELGVRVALGAASGRIVSMVVREGLLLALPGLMVGILGSLWLSDAISALLFGVMPSDPANIALTSSVLLVVTVAACYLPARRAARVDPIVALRSR